MAYTAQQLHDFWYGPGGSVGDQIIRPGAYVSMIEGDVVALTNVQSAAYDAGFSAILGYCFQNKLFGFGNPRTGFDGTGGNSTPFNGPTKS
jgi:hypothetical protein